MPSTTSAPSAADINSLLFGTTYKPAPGTSGGTLVMGDWQPPAQLNLFYSGNTSNDAMSPALRALVTISTDGKYVPDLAASIPTVANGGVVITGNTFTITISLKPGLQWSDGQPLTMNDLAYTWQWANDPAQSGCTLCGSGYPDISAIDVSSDGLTATIHFKDLYSGWLGWLTHPILPAHYFKTIPPVSEPN
jgi:peptide/nickel transport system substrate-binding protein